MYGSNASAAGPALAITGLGMVSLGWYVLVGMTLIATGIALYAFVPRLGRRRPRPAHRSAAR